MVYLFGGGGENISLSPSNRLSSLSSFPSLTAKFFSFQRSYSQFLCLIRLGYLNQKVRSYFLKRGPAKIGIRLKDTIFLKAAEAAW